MTAHQHKPRPLVTPAQHRARKEAAKAKRQSYNHLQKFAGLRYDYGLIDEDKRELVQQAAIEIGKRSRRMVDDAIQIGEHLLAVKELLPHGQFADWWQEEFDFGTRSIQEMMNMARRFAGKSAIIAHLTQTTARLLAAPSIPDDAVDAVIAQAQAKGSPLPVADVRRIVAPYIGNPPGAKRPRPRQLLGPGPDVIDAEYSIVAPAVVVTEPPTFEAWLAAMPEISSLREYLALFALAKKQALRALGDHPKLYNAVYGALPTWSALIHKIEQELKRE